MKGVDDEALHEYVTSRYPGLRRSAFLMCGDWGLADELSREALALLVAESRRGGVDDPDAQLYADVMAAFQHRPARREHVFVAAPDADAGNAERTILVLDALHRLSPRCRAVLVLRHWDGFAVDETADILDLADEKVREYESAGLATLRDLFANTAGADDVAVAFLNERPSVSR
ncbi:sigma factor-like helix-turn-helix DNA-binding protein [Jidongwangia harbinensis]|uniref:sigma factor-like helix-turn-helix DNA-binding protein n=1 Tax=Jidongwangia harbinensis TaxID=2878561 RepID=UPI001CDA3EDE|nr:sigma factor-like helix-turn-helix DNA-binding protein [Jidongwangia harbinensis]MCA2218486.1 SigE family RNA polymerase sigma factor [Jidongwangia harbinensis]